MLPSRIAAAPTDLQQCSQRGPARHPTEQLPYGTVLDAMFDGTLTIAVESTVRTAK